MSLKGMRRELRKSGPRTEQFVRELEYEILAWLDGGVMFAPDAATEMSFPGRAVDSSETVKEVSRTPLQLVWSIEDNAWTRYVVHCCARYHEVVSFSESLLPTSAPPLSHFLHVGKDASGQRLTYLLRPNVTRPTHGVPSGLDTPPATDLESSIHSDFDAGSASDAFSDRCSESGADSDAEPVARTSARALSAIAESAPGTPARTAAPLAPLSDDGWSVVDDADAEESEPEGRLATHVGSLNLGDAEASPRMRQASLRSPLWERQRRSASSPSRSPARRPARMYRVEPPRPIPASRRSFYDYLFS